MEHPSLIKCLNDENASNPAAVAYTQKGPPLLALTGVVNYCFPAR